MTKRVCSSCNSSSVYRQTLPTQGPRRQTARRHWRSSLEGAGARLPVATLGAARRRPRRPTGTAGRARRPGRRTAIRRLWAAAPPTTRKTRAPLAARTPVTGTELLPGWRGGRDFPPVAPLPAEKLAVSAAAGPVAPRYRTARTTRARPVHVEGAHARRVIVSDRRVGLAERAVLDSRSRPLLNLRAVHFEAERIRVRDAHRPCRREGVSCAGCTASRGAYGTCCCGAESHFAESAARCVLVAEASAQPAARRASASVRGGRVQREQSADAARVRLRRRAPACRSARVVGDTRTP